MRVRSLLKMTGEDGLLHGSGGLRRSPTPLSLALIIVWGVLINLGCSAPPSPDPGRNSLGAVVAHFVTINESFVLKHLAIDPYSGRAYVGAVNRLYELDANLRLEATVPTGPKMDNPNCHASGCREDKDSGEATGWTNNVNKVLLVDPTSRALISCGSVSQGACHKYNLTNITLPPEFAPHAVAANDENSSTFAFIGPAKYSMWAISNVLYVGTTFTNNGDYRHDVPAISSRNLYNFDYAEYSFAKQSMLRIDVKYRDHFLVKYVYGFNASNYAYFVIVQKQSYLHGFEEQGYVSRLARTCITDANYDSYTEVTLECNGLNSLYRSNNHNSNSANSYNIIQDAKIIPAREDLAKSLGIAKGDLVFVGVFAQSKGITNEPSTESAICIYSLKDIEAKFTENIHVCFNGTVENRNMDYISGPILEGKCFEPGGAGNIPNFCEVGLKISGSIPIVQTAAIQFQETLLTSVALAVTEQHTVAFVGTSHGTIKKILLSSALRVDHYEDTEVDPGSAILPDTVLDPSGHFLYVLSTNKVIKVRVEQCEMWTNCSTCLNSRDPYCGWCSLEKRCTVRGACKKAMAISPRWLAVGSGQECISFERAQPDRIPVTQLGSVTLVIRPNLPAGAKYKCVFGNAPPVDAELKSLGLECKTPALNFRPVIPDDQDHVQVDLAVRSSETNKDFVSRSFYYYNCTRHTRCRSCVKSSWGCSWCVYENRCVHDTSSCNSSSVVSGEKVGLLHMMHQNPAQMATHGSGFCPRFKDTSEPLLLPNDMTKKIRLEIEHLPRQASHSDFICVIEIEDTTVRVPARVEGGRFVVCEETRLSYKSLTGEYQASVTVLWKQNHHLDTTNFTLYKCEILGSHRGHPDCSLCVTPSNAKYRCTWCGEQCSFRESCAKIPVSKCPKPRIDVIKPLSGPMEGGTFVTIEGSDLGLKEEDVRGKIHIGSVPCELVTYQVSVRIVCRTGPVDREMDSTIQVGNAVGYTNSSVHFSYKNIRLSRITPNKGPRGGGTQLTIVGSHLNIGSVVSVTLQSYPCHVNTSHSSSSRITCTTSEAVSNETITRLQLNIDNAKRMLEDHALYRYIHDPTIIEIKPLKSFVSGGRMITVHGTNLDAIQSPEMIVYADTHTPFIINRTTCAVINPTQMECPSPPINVEFERRVSEASRLTARGSTPKRDRGLETSKRIGFIMDGVSSVLQLQNYLPQDKCQLVYVEDPVVSPFPDNVKLYKGDTLVIEGVHLNEACDETDVTVMIGNQKCNVTSLAQNQLVCTPPDLQPPGTDDSRLPMVTVRVGQFLKFQVGYLQYELTKTSVFPIEAYWIAAVSAMILLAFFGVVVFVYRRKSTQAEREYKRIQIQMDTLESNVRSECKQAFAELQTDMRDLTADLGASAIPYLDHKDYVMKVFFPGVTEHPIIRDPKIVMNGPSTNYDAAMSQFEVLLNNKYFLLAFIETLEGQRSFKLRDKVNVASLLMIILMGKMEYATDILQSLLHRLINKSVGTKYPQLMLRRTETVVEKMLSNWMALCMYSYLKDHAGPSLFLMFKAIKYQIEKGPVDSYTHDARYSLSEERLLREPIDHNLITIHLVQEDPYYEKIPYQSYQTFQVVQEELDEKIQCKVLDCDTISQVKSKILDALYKNTHYSLRPSIHDLDLEWRHGRGGHLTLQDEDLTTRTFGEWKKVNTLAHYGVKDSAVVSLVARPNDSYSNMSLCKKPCNYHNYPTTYLNSTLSGKAGVGNGVGMSVRDRECPVFHLVRPQEDNVTGTTPRNDRTHKAIPEIFLTRLLSTKGTIQKFVDDFFDTIFTVNDSLPSAIKWLFDLLDEAARRHNILDPEVIHAWKSNSYPLRFWINFIKNPDFIFDVEKAPTVEASLGVVMQTLMDACSTSEQRLGKDSPSSKLLFAKDIPHYRNLVSKFYADIKNLPQISDQEMNSAMQQLSMAHLAHFDHAAALKELYIYVSQYNTQILEALEMEPYCKKMHLAHRLDNVACTLEGEETSMC
ncbi:unnamed protein product [Allacma fusca]|uniref:Sema domain-containing protein n=1 Tax=Allacma fusca TaxID=39272 RepID=A0A8J2NSK1_9HEXA|nr:unnamed protein product [Allacma fusca]